jgi:aspartate/tyrosine/aromatic aminotransferase
MHVLIFSFTSELSTDNHELIFRYSGFKDLRYYRYWDPATRNVDFAGMLEDLKKAPQNSVIVLHMAAHNPTGCDLTREQWTMIADVMEVCFSMSQTIVQFPLIQQLIQPENGHSD